MATETQPATGCSFLVRPVGSEAVFTPESLTDEQRLFADAAREFMEREVFPVADELEKLHGEGMAKILKKAGSAGLLMTEVPEAYGGLDLDKVSAMLIGMEMSKYGSFGTTWGAHCSIGTMPIVFFGTEEQRKRFLPHHATGEKIGCYCLTEPGSGSDALGAKTRAVLSEDGSEWILNGQKIWITNAGFADTFTVFAKVDGEHFSGFIVERDRDGLEIGEEEDKLGLHGSSTVQVFFDNVRIPKENLLGEVGKGHKIAFNILNLGRLKLGSGAMGMARLVFRHAVTYANERHQFKRPIASFGAIQQKIAEMAAAIFAGETMAFRIAGAMDETLAAGDKTDPKAALAAVEEFAIEASILKVFGSEALSMVTDEALQIHGGMGFSAEYPIERMYRDIRVNRIFEGTNEINRMLIPGMILKRTVKGQLDLFGAVQQARKALDLERPQVATTDGPLAPEISIVENAKRIVLLVASTAIQKHMTDLRDQQQLLLVLADEIIDLYLMDSVVSRVLLMHQKGAARPIHNQLVSLLVTSAYSRIVARIETLIPSLYEEPSAQAESYGRLDHLRLRLTTDMIRLRRDIAAHFIDSGKFSVGHR